jgi:RHS repeat-associated protein
MTDDTGTVVWEDKYKPFGEAEVHPYSSVANNFRLRGQYYDDETGLHYNYFRDYHPWTGRYIEPDPIGLRGGINMYAYCMNNPVNMVDPSGQFGPVGVVIGGLSGAFAGFVAGAQAGNIWAGVVGGAAGGIVGGAVGFIFPQVSPYVGGIVGGFVGGAIGGGVGKTIKDPHSSAGERLLAMGKGAGIGIITGTITGAVGAAVLSIGATGYAMDLTGAVITTPIACVLGVFSNLFIGRDTEGNITSTLPDDYQYDLSWLFYWNPDNPQEIDRNSSVEISVIGGFPPYTWNVSGNGFSLSLNE